MRYWRWGLLCAVIGLSAAGCCPPFCDVIPGGAGDGGIAATDEDEEGPTGAAGNCYKDPSPKNCTTAVDYPLSVPSTAQVNEYWCWAAVGEMVGEYYSGADIPQCKVATDTINPPISVGPQRCCETVTPPVCKQGAYPTFSQPFFSGVKRTTNKALCWSQLRSELSCNRPVLFTWRWKAGGSHIMVARGFDYVSQYDKQVLVNDPAYWGSFTGSPSVYLIPYEVYRDGDNRVLNHRDDLYNFPKRSTP